MGFQTTGMASQYFEVDTSKVTPLPESMSFDDGAMIEPLAVTVHTAKRFPNIKDSKVIVIGAGPIGILLAQSVKALGAEKVLINDISDLRLEIAKKVGVDFVVM